MHISAYEACLERIAEELMGRRKWKYFQEALTRNHMNTDQLTAPLEKANFEQQNTQLPIKLDQSKSKSPLITDIEEQLKQQPYEENHRQQTDKSKEKQVNGDDNLIKIKKEFNIAAEQETSHKHNNNNNNSIEETEPSLYTNKSITNNSAVIVERSATPESPPPVEPIDWKPNDKCHFCINGKLLTVNAKGELVAESGPAVSEPDHAQRLETDSNDSNESFNKTNNSGTDSKTNNINNLLISQLKGNPANMTSMGSVAAQFALQTLSGQLYQNINLMQLASLQNNSATPTTSDTTAAAVSPPLKDSPSPSDATGEQPLDLSSKPSPNSSISGDLKVTRTKSSRATPTPTTRRTYSDEDLNNALQDILTGKLGTRKAAAQYSVPRSTLRNKVSKMTTEANRTNALEMDDKLSGDEGEDSNASTPQPDTLIDDIPKGLERVPSYLPKFSENNGADLSDINRGRNLLTANASPKLPSMPLDGLKRQTSSPLSIPQSQASPQPQPLLLDVNMLLQALLISTRPQLETMTVSDLFTAIRSVLSVTAGDNAVMNNGSTNMLDQRLLLQQLLQQQQQQQQQVTQFSQQLQKSETPETSSSLDPNELCDDPSNILKIPSYKPVAGTSNSSSTAVNARVSSSPSLLCNNNSNNNANARNGDSPHSAVSPHIANSMLAAAVAAASSNSAAVATNRQNPNIPAMMHARNHGTPDSQSPPAMTIRDVIANSIHRTMNEQANKDAHAAAAASMLVLASDAERNSNSGNSEYKKPSISVVKNIGGTDTSRFGTAPNLLAAVSASSHNTHQHHQPHPHLQHVSSHPHHQHHSAMHLSRQDAAALAAGKGTRPKRGKYRNYDRDSLTEAVKAVQRGEMSVHRAGSYYGVPHSTLEYKVKERHLMRPRKREPKPQPGLDSTSSASTSKSNSNIPGLNNLDKMKSNVAGTNSKLSNALKSNSTNAPAFSNVSAFTNGMKLPMFDPTMAAQLQYGAPFGRWPHTTTAFNQMQMDFNRNAQSGNAVKSDLLKTLYQEEAMRAAVASGNGSSTATSANSPSPIASPMLGQNHHGLYDGSNVSDTSNILDDIIRQTLDRKSSHVTPSNVLLDQLLTSKPPLPFTNNQQNDYGGCGSNKRTGSPISYSNIKRERSSPMQSTDDDDTASQSGNEDVPEHNNNKSKNLSGNGGLIVGDNAIKRQQRSRMTSRDSDASSLKSELMILNQSHNNNSNNKMAIDLNGSATLKSEISDDVDKTNSNTTSILHEKLAQIKAERESEENL